MSGWSCATPGCAGEKPPGKGNHHFCAACRTRKAGGTSAHSGTGEASLAAVLEHLDVLHDREACLGWLAEQLATYTEGIPSASRGGVVAQGVVDDYLEGLTEALRGVVALREKMEGTIVPACPFLSPAEAKPQLAGGGNLVQLRPRPR